tara:strand:- start:473 stop:1348 length:876 start_codon:yes stop_codon:yes gene_type:complete
MNNIASNKEYLVILAGSPRGGEKTWESLFNNVINPLNADLAICCSNKWDQNNSLFKNAKYKWIFNEYDDYKDYYKERFKGTWEEYFKTGIDTGLYTSGLVHFVFKDIIKNQYLEILEKYKYIIYTRFDQFYLNTHPEVKDNEILIPEGEDYFGICDRHAAFPSKYSEDFLSICEYVDNKIALENVPDFNNCETTFLSHMKANGLLNKVKRFKRMQFTASLKGEHTNWRVAKYRVYFYKDLMTKYPNEFMDGVKNTIDAMSLTKFLFQKPIISLNYYYLKLRRIVGRIKSNF